MSLPENSQTSCLCQYIGNEMLIALLVVYRIDNLANNPMCQVGLYYEEPHLTRTRVLAWSPGNHPDVLNVILAASFSIF